MTTYFEVTSTAKAEFGALIPVDAYGRPVYLKCDGIRIESIDISDIYYENDVEWDRAVKARLETYGLTATRADYFGRNGFKPRWKLI